MRYDAHTDEFGLVEEGKLGRFDPFIIDRILLVSSADPTF